jgi:hypothetical protein
MRTISLALALLCVTPLRAQRLQILERGPNWRTIEELHPNGETTRYTELRSGLHYLDPDEPGVWKESVPVIEVLNGAAVARQGQIRAIWAANLGAPEGVIDLLSPGNRRFRVSPVGLAYTSRTGRSVMIAGARDVEGFVHENSVYYFDAFDGGFAAVIQIVYRLG